MLSTFLKCYDILRCTCTLKDLGCTYNYMDNSLMTKHNTAVYYRLYRMYISL